MTRRIFSVLAVMGFIGAMTGVEDMVSPSVITPVGTVYFLLLLVYQVWPLYMTRRDAYGRHTHPVNKMYSLFGALGLVGTLFMMVLFYTGSTVSWVAVAGSLMFMGIVGAGVLAFFATPWRDHTYRALAAEH
ncbi:MAG TPA: hypothetical protein H9867_01215 [Candidatus Corynebacterium gallistercoris]|uniref:Uncharacterized protein n=1 Tax=Candidatus Corynebacterium gallistercoris TaxID=2838530 RepID=A0A9D1UP73_9CORY|nr:hypothetical protein [Candidatus Corynebacterium gallistercoris]